MNPPRTNTSHDDADGPGISASRPRMTAQLAAGKALRQHCPRDDQDALDARRLRRDPLAVIQAGDMGRIASLLPIKNARMAVSPLAFYRGAAALMAYDLATTPRSGVEVQLCGDAHLLNFGGFASPERTLLFGLNDFDETLPGPFEWDIKRLAASFVLAARERGFSEARSKETVLLLVQCYRESLHRFAGMHALDVWYQRVTFDDLIALAHTRASRKQGESLMERARQQTAESLFAKMTHIQGGQRRITDNPPLVYHPKTDDKLRRHFKDFFDAYRASLPNERRALVDRYAIVDVAFKVVGVGSVGTRCLVALLMADDDDALFLQFKEARPSCLAGYLAPGRHGNQGERVVQGQRRAQSISDIFLGWAHSPHDDRDFYVRQLRDMKISVTLDELDADELEDFAQACAMALSRAHAKSGDAALLAGYLGNSDTFDRAIGQFAHAYADQTERDFEVFKSAIAAGKLPVADNAKHD